MSKASRRQTREQLREQRLREQRRAQRVKLLAILGAAVAVLALAVGGGYLYMADRGQSSDFAGSLAPRELQEDGSVVMAREGVEAPVVEVYVDYQCPACAQFEEVNRGTLQELAADGDAIVHIRPVSIFAQQPEPTSGNSLRGAAAARAAADHGAFIEYSGLLWENQPSEQESGFGLEELRAWGEEAGITDPAFAERLESETEAVAEFVDYYPSLVERAQGRLTEEELGAMSSEELVEWGERNGVAKPDLEGTYVQETLDRTDAVKSRYSEGDNRFGGTPSVYVNGELLGQEAYTVDGLRGAVAEAGPGEVNTEPYAGDDSEARPSPTASGPTDGGDGQ